MNSSEASELDIAMMHRAIALAEAAAEMDEVPVGAVIYRGDDVLAEAANRCETDTDATAHAEMLVIRAASQKIGDWRLEECTLAVTLEPCTMCAGAMVNARVGRLVYGATDPKGGGVESLYQICNDDRLNHRVTVVSGVLAEPCGQLLTDFFRKKRAARKAARQARAE